MKHKTSFATFQKVELTPRKQNEIKGGTDAQAELIESRLFENVELDLGTVDLF